MARLTFDTPAGDYCDGHGSKCVMYNGFWFCDYFKELLTGDDPVIRKCDACMSLGKYGAANYQDKCKGLKPAIPSKPFMPKNLLLLTRMNELVTQYMRDGWLLTGSNSSYGHADLRECMSRGNERIAIVARFFSSTGKPDTCLLEIRKLRDEFIDAKDAPLLAESYYVVGNRYGGRAWSLTSDLHFAVAANEKSTERAVRNYDSNAASMSLLSLNEHFLRKVLATAHEHHGFTKSTAKHVLGIWVARECYGYNEEEKAFCTYTARVMNPSGKRCLEIFWSSCNDLKTGKFCSRKAVDITETARLQKLTP